MTVRHKFDRSEFHRLADWGFFQDARVELIAGDILDMTPVGSAHKACVSRLTHMLVQALTGRAVVYVQNPLVIGDSEPLPDVSVLRPEASHYASRDATAADALLVIEVADSSFQYDATTKASLYAGAGIAEYWLIDLNKQRVRVHRTPQKGVYQVTQDIQMTQDTSSTPTNTLRPQHFSDVTLNISDILGRN